MPSEQTTLCGSPQNKLDAERLAKAPLPLYEVGQVVRFRESSAYGAEIAPALVTRVWGPDCYNLWVFPADSVRECYAATSVNIGNRGFYIEK